MNFPKSLAIRASLALLLSVALQTSGAFGQAVSINSTGTAPDAQSILDISSTSKGVLLPRMTSVQRTAVAPTNGSDHGMTVYDITTQSYWYWDGTANAWREIPNTAGIVTTLDGAYDGGGSGVGRIITADAGAVDIQGTGGLLVSGQTAINTTPQSNFKLSILANSGTQGLTVTSSGGGAYGISSSTATAATTPIFGNNTSTSTGSTYSAVQGALSTPVATNGYLGYHTSGNNSYAVYGNGGTYAGYFNGNTLVTGGNLGVGMTTAATERLQVAGGNVFISSASSKLMAGTAFDISGQSGIDIIIDDDNNSTNAAFRIQKDLGTDLFELQEDGDIFFSDLAGAGSNLLQSDASGQVTRSGIAPNAIVSGSGTPTQVAYFDAAQNITSEADLFWDPVNNRLGIGMNSPDRDLHVSSANGAQIIITRNDAATNAGETLGDLQFDSEDNTGPSLIGASAIIRGIAAEDHGNSNKGGHLAFLTQQTGTSNTASERMRIQSNGNIGIGTQAPSAQLHTTGTVRLENLTGVGTRMVMADPNGNLSTQTNPGGDITDVLAGAGITGGGTSGSVTVTASANNGLNVDAGADAIQLGGALTENTNIPLGGFNMVFDMTSSGDFEVRDNGVSALFVRDDGRVGIGDSSPDAQLDVDAASGDLLILAQSGTERMRVDISGNAWISGKFNSNGIEELSDQRFKKNITPLAGTLDKVLQIQGVTYNWRQEEFPDRSFGSQKEIGFIAQELEKTYPELVSTNEEGFKSVQYSHMVPVLLEAIKEQQAIIIKLLESDKTHEERYVRLKEFISGTNDSSK